MHGFHLHVSSCEVCFDRNISAPGRGGWDPRSFVSFSSRPPKSLCYGDVLRSSFTEKVLVKWKVPPCFIPRRHTETVALGPEPSQRGHLFSPFKKKRVWRDSFMI